MTAHKRHAAMKDSNVAWLGKIPAHWDVVQSRRMFDERKEKARPGDVLLTASQKYGMIPQSEFVELEGRRVVEINKGADSLIHVEAGDFVISLRSFQGGLEFSRTAGAITFHYVPIHALKWVYEPFFAHLFKSSTYIQALRATANLIRDGQDMRYSHFAQVPLPLVPLEEQAAIADHLDRETAHIDKLIARKTRFIELLAEKRQTLIIHTVTKGLNQNAKMKDSGVEWLGRVPTHWRVGRLKHLGRLKGGSGFPPHLQGRPDNELSFYKVGNLGKSPDGRHLGDTNNTITPQEAKEIGATIFSLNTIAWAKIGAALMLNRRRILQAPACLDNNMTGFTINESVVTLSFAFYLTSAIDFTVHAKPGAVPSFSEGDQGELDVPIPSIPEQSEISEYLDTQTVRIDTLIAKTLHSIELLREHRTALISAAVTGKIDLRENA